MADEKDKKKEKKAGEPKKEEVKKEEKPEAKPAAEEQAKEPAAEEAEEEVEVPEKFQSIVSEIEKMSVLDLSELVQILEKKFGVTAAAPVAAAAGPAGAEGEAAAEEKSEFNIELADAGGNKIQVIKAVREVTEMGLKDAKDLVDGAPKVVKEGVPKEEAEEIKKKLEEAGAKVELK